MKSILIKLITPFIVIGSLTSIAFAKSAVDQPINLSAALQSAIKYHDSGTYKAKMRKQITDAGYMIIFNMGDQYSDLKGGFAEKSFKLPNPYYLVP